ncbi:MAG: DMT family transporter [Armatimonadetes bacterium]|nr:DMT family transporter [Armatimonadota bacterium]
MPPHSDRRALSFAVLTMVTWATAGVFVRLLMARLTGAAPFQAFAIMGGRLSLALLLLSVLLAIFQRQQLRSEVLPALRRRETWIAGGSQFAYYLLAVCAFTFAPIGVIALCASTAPLWVLLIRVLRGGRIAGAELAGATVALAGVGVIVLPGLLRPVANDPFPHTVWGMGLSLASACVTALYALFQRQQTARNTPTDPRALSLVTFALGVPLLYFFRPVPASELMSGQTVALFAGFAAFATVLPNLAFAWASRRLPPVSTATVALLLPVFATTFAAIVLRETPPWTLLPGGVLVMLGLWLILRPPRPVLQGDS